MDFTFSEQLHYLIHHSDGEYVAHCLDLDLVGSGAKIEDAVAELNTAVRAIVYFALRNSTIEHLNNCKKAPERYWEMFEEVRRTGKTEVRTLEINPEMAPVTVSQCHFTYCLAMAA